MVTSGERDRGRGNTGVGDFLKDAGDTGDVGSIPGSRRSPGEGNGNPLQYFFLKKSHRQRSLQATVQRVAKSWDITEHTQYYI